MNNRNTPPAGSSSMALPSGSVGTTPATAAGITSPFGTSSSAATTAATDTPVATESASKLTVGPNIKLKGVEITDCDTLVVEGLVEATMDSRVIQISEQGAFKGSAEIDIAEIHGVFEGTLVARQKLVIYSTGKVTGKVRYGKIVIEEGGQLGGEIQYGVGPASGAASAAGSSTAGSSSGTNTGNSLNSNVNSGSSYGSKSSSAALSSSQNSRERDGVIITA